LVEPFDRQRRWCLPNLKAGEEMRNAKMETTKAFVPYFFEELHDKHNKLEAMVKRT
jgi:hypothetical protein